MSASPPQTVAQQAGQPPPLPSQRSQVLDFAPVGYSRFLCFLFVVPAYQWGKLAWLQVTSWPVVVIFAAVVWLACRGFVNAWLLRAFVTPSHLLIRSILGWQALRYSDVEAWAVAFDGTLSLRLRGYDEPDCFAIASYQAPDAMLDALAQRIQAPIGHGARATPSVAVVIDILAVCLMALAATLHNDPAAPSVYLVAAAALGIVLFVLARWKRKAEERLDRGFGVFDGTAGLWIWWVVLFVPGSGETAKVLSTATSLIFLGVGVMLLAGATWRWLEHCFPNLFTRPLYK